MKRWEGSRGVRLYASLTSTDRGMRLATDWITRASTRRLASLAAGEARVVRRRRLDREGHVLGKSDALAVLQRQIQRIDVVHASIGVRRGLSAWYG